MSVLVKRAEFTKALGAAAKVCSRAQIPMFQGIELDLGPEGLWIWATNGVLTIRMRCDIENESAEEWRAFVSGTASWEVVKRLDAERLEVGFEDECLLVKTEGGKWAFRCREGEIGQMGFEGGVAVRVDGAELARKLQSVSFARSPAERYPGTSGILLRKDGASLVLWATDGSSLCRAEVAVKDEEGGEAARIVLPEEAMAAVEAASGEVELRWEENKARISGADLVAETAVLSRFPRVEDVFADKLLWAGHFETGELRSALARCMALERRVFLAGIEGGIRLRSFDSEVGSAEESLSGEEVEGEWGDEMLVDGQKLARALNQVKDEFCEVSVRRQGDCGERMVCLGTPGWVYELLPMRIP